MSKDSFKGFEAPNTTPVPDIVFDELLSELTGNELKVLLYIIRRTYGFGKNADAISLSQFREGITTQGEKVLDKGCGIKHNRTILAALAILEKRGCVIAKKRTTHAGDSDTTIYQLRFKDTPVAKPDHEVVTSGNHVVTPSNDGGYPTSLRLLPEVTTVVTPGNTQETVIQETVIQEERENPPAHHDAHASAHTPSASSSEQKLQQIIEDKTANGVGSPPAPSKEALNRTPETSSPRQKGTRKPKAEQVEKGTMSPARIESVFEYFDELGAEVTGDPSYCYERSKINKECIGNLLSVPKRAVTRESLRSVYLKLWTSPPDPVTGFSWQDNMSIKAVCRNYDRILLSIKGKDKAKSPSEQQKTISGKQRVEVPDDIFAAMMNASGGGGY